MKGRRLKQDPLLFACALVPVAGLVLLYSFAVRARLALGKWPLPYSPDPKNLGFAIHDGAVAVLLTAAIASPIAFGICLLARRSESFRGRPKALSMGLYTVGYAALWMLLVGDPGSIVEWYLD